MNINEIKVWIEKKTEFYRMILPDGVYDPIYIEGKIDILEELQNEMSNEDL